MKDMPLMPGMGTGVAAWVSSSALPKATSPARGPQPASSREERV